MSFFLLIVFELRKLRDSRARPRRGKLIKIFTQKYVFANFATEKVKFSFDPLTFARTLQQKIGFFSLLNFPEIGISLFSQLLPFCASIKLRRDEYCFRNLLYKFLLMSQSASRETFVNLFCF